MSFRKALLSLLIVLCATGAAFGQEEWQSKLANETFGVGFVVSPKMSGTPSYGPVLTYVLTPTFHFGTELGFYYEGSDASNESRTYLSFAPYGKMILEPMKNFFPFVRAAFRFESLPEQEVRSGNESKFKYRTVSSTALQIACGGEWFPYKSVGVYGGIEFIKYDFDRSKILGGLGPAFVGIEWFF